MSEVALRLGDALTEARDLLRAAAVPAPGREAQRLVEDLLGLPPGQLPLRRADPLSGEDAERLRAAACRRAAGEPLAYVTGWAGFRRLTLASDPRALIPRPETEQLVQLVLDRVPGGRVADLGTGSGCIALSLADEGGYRDVVAVDRSAAALALAGANGRRLGLSVRWIQGDWCLPLAPRSLDAVVANPPYLTDGEYAELDPAVRAHEPASALASGPDGFDATDRLLADGRRVVRPGGWIALEVDCTRADAVAVRAAQAGWLRPTIHLDLFGRERFVLAQQQE